MGSAGSDPRPFAVEGGGRGEHGQQAGCGQSKGCDALHGGCCAGEETSVERRGVLVGL